MKLTPAYLIAEGFLIGFSYRHEESGQLAGKFGCDKRVDFRFIETENSVVIGENVFELTEDFYERYTTICDSYETAVSALQKELHKLMSDCAFFRFEYNKIMAMPDKEGR